MCRYLGHNRRIPCAQPRLPTLGTSLELSGIALTLKGTCAVLAIASEGDLRFPSFQNVDNLYIRNIAHLVVLMYDFSILVTHSSFDLGHQRVTCLIRRADIAIDTRPSIFAFAVVPLSHGSIYSVCQRSTNRRQTVVSSVSRRACTFAVVLITFGILTAGKGRQKTIKATAGQYHMPLCRDR